MHEKLIHQVNQEVVEIKNKLTLLFFTEEDFSNIISFSEMLEKIEISEFTTDEKRKSFLNSKKESLKELLLIQAGMKAFNSDQSDRIPLYNRLIRLVEKEIKLLQQGAGDTQLLNEYREIFAVDIKSAEEFHNTSMDKFSAISDKFHKELKKPEAATIVISPTNESKHHQTITPYSDKDKSLLFKPSIDAALSTAVKNGDEKMVDQLLKKGAKGDIIVGPAF